MIYLIGGPPKCGKTTLAKQLSKSAGVPWVSTDTIQNVIKPYIPKNDFATMFPSSTMRFDSNDEKYAKHTSSEIVDAYRCQARTVCAAIEAFVDSEVTDGNDYIIEGFHVEPELIVKLRSKYPELIRGTLVVKKDADAFIKNIHQSKTPNDWIRSKTNDETITFPRIAAMVVDYGIQLEKDAEENDVTVFGVDQGFESQLHNAANYLLGTA